MKQHVKQSESHSRWTPKKSATTFPAVNNGPQWNVETIDMIYSWPAECLIETSQPRIWLIKRAKILTPGSSLSFGSRATIGEASDKKRWHGRLLARDRGLVPVNTCSSLGNFIGVSDWISVMRFRFTLICILFFCAFEQACCAKYGIAVPNCFTAVFHLFLWAELNFTVFYIVFCGGL